MLIKPTRSSKMKTQYFNSYNRTMDNLLRESKILLWYIHMKTTSKELIEWPLHSFWPRFLIEKYWWTTSRTNVECTHHHSEIWTKSLLLMSCVGRNSYWNRLKSREYLMHLISRNFLLKIYGLALRNIQRKICFLSTFLISKVRISRQSNI